MPELARRGRVQGVRATRIAPPRAPAHLRAAAGGRGGSGGNSCAFLRRLCCGPHLGKRMGLVAGRLLHLTPRGRPAFRGPAVASCTATYLREGRAEPPPALRNDGGTPANVCKFELLVHEHLPPWHSVTEKVTARASRRWRRGARRPDVGATCPVGQQAGNSTRSPLAWAPCSASTQLFASSPPPVRQPCP